MSEWIAHSRGPWKEHKYLRKEGVGDNAQYIYSESQSRSVKPNGPLTADDQFMEFMDDYGEFMENLGKKLYKKFPKFDHFMNTPIVELAKEPLYYEGRVAGDFTHLIDHWKNKKLV